MRMFVDCKLLSDENICYLAKEMGIQEAVFKWSMETHERFLAYIGPEKDTTHFMFTSASAVYDRNTHYYLCGDAFVSKLQKINLMRIL